jgi:hypothetical protein
VTWVATAKAKHHQSLLWWQMPPLPLAASYPPWLTEKSRSCHKKSSINAWKHVRRATSLNLSGTHIVAFSVDAFWMESFSQRLDSKQNVALSESGVKHESSAMLLRLSSATNTSQTIHQRHSRRGLQRRVH